MAQAKIRRYEEFLSDRLKPNLVQSISLRDKAFEQLDTFTDLAKNIRTLQQNELKKVQTIINLGSEVYVQADVPDTSFIYVDIGLGFHAEFTLEEALVFIDDKQRLLRKEIEDHSRTIAGIKGDIKLVTEGIREMMLIPEKGR